MDCSSLSFGTESLLILKVFVFFGGVKMWDWIFKDHWQCETCGFNGKPLLRNRGGYKINWFVKIIFEILDVFAIAPGFFARFTKEKVCPKCNSVDRQP